MKEPCGYCENALVSDYLDNTNDYACFSIGYMPDRKRMMLCTGYGKPLRIEIEEFNDQYGKWSTIGVYYLRYCPMCGREICEYKIDSRGRKYERNC